MQGDVLALVFGDKRASSKSVAPRPRGSVSTDTSPRVSPRRCHLSWERMPHGSTHRALRTTQELAPHCSHRWSKGLYRLLKAFPGFSRPCKALKSPERLLDALCPSMAPESCTRVRDSERSNLIRKAFQLKTLLAMKFTTHHHLYW